MSQRRKNRDRRSSLPVFFVIAASAVTCHAQVSFRILPGASWPSTVVRSMNADATVLAGLAPVGDDEQQVFRWSAASGYADLGLNAGWTRSWLGGISADGSTIAGGAMGPDYDIDAFLWTESSGLRELAAPDGVEYCQANGITPDGRVIVGSAAVEGQNVVVRWVDGQFQDLGHAAVRMPDAKGVSDDGSAIATSENWDGNLQAGRWTEAGGFELLGGLTTNGASEAWQISGDGRTIVGLASVADGMNHAFAWTSESGMVDLGLLPGDLGSSVATAVSCDGSVIAGTSGWFRSNRAFLWTSATGLVDLREYLIEQGVTELAGWQLHSVTDLSGDGRILIGTASSDLGEQYQFVATIPSPPVAACGMGIFAFARRRR